MSDRSNTPFRRTLVYLLARSRGGHNRCRILKLLQDRGPLNANQIASALELHYTTVQHHLTKLARDDVVAASPRGESYGALFFLRLRASGGQGRPGEQHAREPGHRIAMTGRREKRRP